MRWRSATAAGLSALPNGRDLTTSPASTESVSITYAVSPLRARGARRSGRVSCEAPRDDGAPVARDEDARQRRPSPPRNAVFARSPPLSAELGDDGHADEAVSAGRARRGVDQVVHLLAVAAPAAPVATRGRDRAPVELERELVGDADGPGAAADGEVAAGVDEARAAAASMLGDAVDGVALADAAEVEVRARLELDRRAVDDARLRRSAARPARRVAAVPSAGSSSKLRS